jgi:serine/threonine-protein kinase RsbW
LEVDVWDYGNPIPDDQLEHAGSSTFDFEPTDTGALPEGGMGLALIKAAFDEVDYASDGRENWLHLILHFRSTHLSRRLGHA